MIIDLWYKEPDKMLQNLVARGLRHVDILVGDDHDSGYSE